jgi:septal ring factor EnvC (AmiA/AmiB activator)
MIEQRVASLERSVERLDFKVDRIDEALKRIEEALKALADDNKSFSISLAGIRENVAHIDGRLANIPTFWQTLALIATLLIGIAGLIFTASRFLHP